MKLETDAWKDKVCVDRNGSLHFTLKNNYGSSVKEMKTLLLLRKVMARDT